MWVELEMYRPPVASPAQPARQLIENKMAEKKTVKKADPRQKAYDAFLKTYAEANPVKYAAKKERGDFDDIPESFIVGDQLVNYDS